MKAPKNRNLFLKKKYYHSALSLHKSVALFMYTHTTNGTTKTSSSEAPNVVIAHSTSCTLIETFRLKLMTVNMIESFLPTSSATSINGFCN